MNRAQQDYLRMVHGVAVVVRLAELVMMGPDRVQELIDNVAQQFRTAQSNSGGGDGLEPVSPSDHRSA